MLEMEPFGAQWSNLIVSISICSVSYFSNAKKEEGVVVGKNMNKNNIQYVISDSDYNSETQ